MAHRETHAMTCKEAQGYMKSFFENELDIDLADSFLKHVRECDECREEMQITHVLLTALDELNTDTDSDGDYPAILNKKLKITEVRIEKHKKIRMLNRILLPVLMILLLIVTGYSRTETLKPRVGHSGNVPGYLLENWCYPKNEEGMQALKELVANRKSGHKIMAAYLKQNREPSREKKKNEFEPEDLIE